ncbi:hypothetical protein I4U23_029326 [Adineta vaga]|nr:hypothetical protein I4U23_029326 [Adineta vaga]
MHYYQKFAIIGFILGLIAIILGIAGLTTSAWISVTYDSSYLIAYDLFHEYKNGTIEQIDDQSFRISQCLEITGYTVLVIGIVLGVFCTGFIDKRSIHFIAPIIIIIGTLLILIGIIFYIKSIVEMDHKYPIERMNFCYSIILMMTTSIIGCILTVYFSFTSGYIHRHILSTVNIY